MISRHTFKTFFLLAASLFVLLCVPCFSVHASEVEYIGYSTDGFIDVMPERGRFEALDSAIQATFQNRGLYENFTYEVWQRFSDSFDLDSYVNSGDLLVNVYFSSDWNYSWSVDPEFDSFGINTIVLSRQDYFLPTWQHTSSSGFYNDFTFLPFVNGIPFRTLNNYFTSDSFSLFESDTTSPGGTYLLRWHLTDNTLSYFDFSSSSSEIILDWLDHGTGVFIITLRDYSAGYSNYINLNYGFYTSDSSFDIPFELSLLPRSYSDFVQMFPVFDLNSQYEISRFSLDRGEPQFILEASDNIDFSVPMLSVHNPYFLTSGYPGLTPTPIIPTPTPFPTFLIGTPSPQPFPSSFPSPAIGFTDLDQTIEYSALGVNTFVSGVAFLGVLRDLVNLILNTQLGSYIVIIVTAAALFFILGFGASGVIRVIRHNDSHTKKE